MILYKTKANNIINLDQVSVIYVDPDWTDKRYKVVTSGGDHIPFPELTEDNIEEIMKIQNKIYVVH